jgi:hypothetical protein
MLGSTYSHDDVLLLPQERRASKDPNFTIIFKNHGNGDYTKKGPE